MAVGRLSIGNSVLKLVLQIVAGGCFYVAVLYVAKDEMLKEILGLAGRYLKKLSRLFHRD